MRKALYYNHKEDLISLLLRTHIMLPENGNYSIIIGYTLGLVGKNGVYDIGMMLPYSLGTT